MYFLLHTNINLWIHLKKLKYICPSNLKSIVDLIHFCLSVSLCLKEQYQSFASDSYNLKECTEVDVEL